MRQHLPMLVAITLAACGRSAAPASRTDNRAAPGAPEASAATDAGRVAESPPASDAVPSTQAANDSAAALPAGSRAERGDHCRTDAQCGWDDPCMPTRCGTVAAAAAAGCDESMRPPGACTCVERQCTLRPTAPARADSPPGCATEADCALDVGTATCHLARQQDPLGPIAEQGPVCTCTSGRCGFDWIGPVACKSWRDCSWTTAPRLRPAPASTVPRPVDHPVAPCKDGERDSVCTPAGTCRVVAWSC